MRGFMNETTQISKKVDEIAKGLIELFDLLEGADEDADFVWTDDDGTEIKLTAEKLQAKTKSIGKRGVVERCKVDYGDSRMSIEIEY